MNLRQEILIIQEQRNYIEILKQAIEHNLIKILLMKNLDESSRYELCWNNNWKIFKVGDGKWKNLKIFNNWTSNINWFKNNFDATKNEI